MPHHHLCVLHGVQDMALSRMPTDPWNARAGGQYPRSGKGLYPPWKDSTGADKSDTSSLTFPTAATFEAFSCHPRRRCCCRGCRSAPRSGDRPRTAAAAASAPCPCERGHSQTLALPPATTEPHTVTPSPRSSLKPELHTAKP